MAKQADDVKKGTESAALALKSLEDYKAEQKAAADKMATDAKAAADKTAAEAKAAADKAAEEAKKNPAPAPAPAPAPTTTDPAKAAEEAKKAADKVTADIADAKTSGVKSGDTSWMLVSSAFVMLMVPGLALFYGGMVRRKNVLATMMQSMAALGVVGIYWLAFGYGLAFGPSKFTLSLFGVENGGLLGWSWHLFFLNGVTAGDYLPNANIPVYTHVMFQGMFAIITPALISGAVAERIRFWPFCIFMILWITLVYCPLAHMVWAFDWFTEEKGLLVYGAGKSAIGFLGKMGALDYAGGTVVHIAAGFAGLACMVALRKRIGYPEHPMHPNSMVLTLTGAALLWFGWFGFNGGSAVSSGVNSSSAFSATQAAAAGAAISWILVEWLVKGKPTALGLASGVVAGLVAVTPASGYVTLFGGLLIGLIAGVVCYGSVYLKSVLGYDDSLDAFGVHGVGGFLGAVLTGFFCASAVNSAAVVAPAADGLFTLSSLKSSAAALPAEIEKLKASSAALDPEIKTAETESKAAEDKKDDKAKAEADEKKTAAEGKKALLDAAVAARETELKRLAGDPEEKTDEAKKDGLLKTYDKKGFGSLSQVKTQLFAATLSAVFAFVVSLVLALAVQAMTGGNFTTSAADETEGLDLTEHGEVGFDFGPSLSTPLGSSVEPRAARIPPDGKRRFALVVEGGDAAHLARAWSECCQPGHSMNDPDFQALYPNLTTVSGNTFRFRAGDPSLLSRHLKSLLDRRLNSPVSVRVES